jgi:hypothetical protein
MEAGPARLARQTRCHSGFETHPVDLDPRSKSPSRYGPTGPNLLVDMDPFSGYGPPFLNTFIY